MISAVEIRLRAWEENDIPALMSMRNDVALQAMLLSTARGSNESQVRDWLIERSSGTGNRFFVIAEVQTNQPLGYMQFVGIDPVNRNAELGICLSRDAQGKGMGSQALRVAIHELKKTGEIRKITLRVRTDNEIAIKSYQRIGFRRCGLLEKHVNIEGEWLDLILMEFFL